MLNIRYFVSDYGYGHASRSIAIIRKVLDSVKDVTITVKTGFPFDFVRRSLPSANVETIMTKNDMGPAFNGNSAIVDADKTRHMLDEWVAGWDEYVRREAKSCRSDGTDLIISDIAPQPFLVAEELGLPSVAISNFTWHYIFSAIVGECESIERMRSAYGCAGEALVLPFSEEMKPIKERREVGLVARGIDVDRSRMRRQLGVGDDEVLVFLGIGKSFGSGSLEGLRIADGSKIRLLVSSHVRLHTKDFISVPAEETETQNYVAACDLVVSKAGYGIVSEAVQGRVPIFLFKREGFNEDKLFEEAIERMGIGQVVSWESFLNFKWVNDLERIEKYKHNYEKLPGRLVRDGALEAAGRIAEITGLKA